MDNLRQLEILKYHKGAFSRETDLVVEECRININVNGRPYVSVMATPLQLDVLALGYLFSEGVIEGLPEVSEVVVDGYNVNVGLRKPVPVIPARARSSGFGLGTISLSELSRDSNGLDQIDPPRLSAGRLIKLMEEFNDLSELFRKTGAVHSAWLLTGENRFFSEDVGRHNALDKVIGQYLVSGSRAAEPGLVFSTGRISAEMILKTAKAKMGAIVTRGAASELAVDLAGQYNIVLVGFLRGSQFTVYHGGELISESDQAGGGYEGA